MPLAQIPIYSASPANKAAGCPSSTLRDKIAPSRPLTWPPQLFYEHSQSCAADRFIPRRYRRNFDAINHNLTKVPSRLEKPTELDIFEQIVILDRTWRKRMMHNALGKTNIFEELNDPRVLNFTEHRKKHEKNTNEPNPPNDSCIWRSKARNKPLISRFEFAVKAPGMTMKPGMLGWSAKNFIATVIDKSVIIFDASNSKGREFGSQIKMPDTSVTIMAIRWNHAGTAIAVVSSHSKVQVHWMEQVAWIQECKCTSHGPGYCEVLSIAWTRDDKQIVTGCSEGTMLAYDTSSGELIDATLIDINPITVIEFSLNDRYLASVTDTLRLHAWPSLTPYLQIGTLSNVLVKSLAWHPWESNILCLGGSPFEDYLELWNMGQPKCLGFRKVRSVSYVNGMTWNKLSGELVVEWRYLDGNRYKSAVCVLDSLDRVVDVVSTTIKTSDLAWNPDNTQLAIRVHGQIKSWNFFGNETKKWHDPERENDRKKNNSLMSKKAMYNDQTIHFPHYNIR